MTIMQSLPIVVVFIITLALIKVIYLELGKQDIEKNLRNFSLNTPLYSERFPLILKSFLSGSNETLRIALNMNRLRNFLEVNFSSYYKGFAYEGVGMGFGIRAEFSFNKAKTFEKYIKKLSPNHIYQFYVGLGWWLLIRHGYQEDKYEKWFKKLCKKYFLITLDGVGFKTGLYSNKKNDWSFKKFDHFKNDYQRVCFQGFGRSIWFQSEFQIKESMKKLHLVPEEYRKDAASGLGLAVAYSFFDQLSQAFIIYDSIPHPLKSAFAQGMSFGLEARRLQDPNYWTTTLESQPEVNKLFINTWIQIVHKVETELSDQENNFYLNWMDKVRNEIREKGEKHEIF
ncbi:DUF1702 family protein [Cytobacillus oceanisediminis]|uniref:DUF1702 family protein n=1 Tax=Cytobacillus oceanisediminis TaxID=665099 RepID=UPI001C22CDEC|nr:DUF1702 family protein [Cytobacillus oceanisediminis]MBU8772033.1 DUF1702 family protein [Cytobacillus oceanisediminis]